MTQITTLSPQLAQAVRRMVRESLHQEEQRRREPNSRHEAPAAHYVGIITEEVTPAEIVSGDVVAGSGEASLYLRQNNGTLKFVVADQPVYQLGTRAITVGERHVLHGDQWGDFFVVPASARVRFRTTAAIVNRTVAAVVDLADLSGTLQAGDALTVHDPNNLWPEIVSGCNGWAYWRPGAGLRPGRWEIEDCSLPANELKGTLTAKLKKTDAIGTVAINIAQTIRSAYNSQAIPPEAYQDGNGDWFVPFQNNWGLDACKDSDVVLQRIGNKQWADPENLDTPKAGSMTSPAWEIVKIKAQKARWIVAVYDDEDEHTIDSFWEGQNPLTCDTGETLTITAPLGMPCPLDGEKVMCSYRPETDDYAIVSTVSAMLGTPETGQFAVGDSFASATCGAITYTSQVFKYFPCCEEESPGGGSCTISKNISLGFSVVAAITGVTIGTDSGGNYCYQFARASVLSCGGANPATTYLCGYNCPPVCEETLYYWVETYAAGPPPEGSGFKYVGTTDPGGDNVYEACFDPGTAPEGYIEGSADAVMSENDREYSSPVCCPEE